LSAVEEPFRSIVGKALEKDPDERFSGASEMLAALEYAIATGEYVSFAPVSSTPGAPLRGPAHLGTGPEQLKAGQLGAGDYRLVSPRDAAREDVLVIDDAPLPRRGEPLPSLEGSHTLFISEQVVADNEMSFGPVHEKAVSDPRGAPAKKPSPYKPARAAPPAARRPAQAGPSWNQTREWWNRSRWSTPVKLLVLFVLVLAVLMSAPWMLPLALAAAAVVLVVVGVRAIVSGGAATQPSPFRPPVTYAAAIHQRAQVRRTTLEDWRHAMRRRMSEKSTAARIAELAGSLLMSSIVVGVLSLVLMMAAGVSLDGSVGSWAFFVWFTLTAIAGSWTVLAVSKLWEGRDGDPMIRRFLLLVLGMGLGAVSFLAWRMLFVDVQLDRLTQRPIAPEMLADNMYSAAGGVQLAGFLVYFGGLLVALRWWRQADPLRTTRVSVWSVAVAGLWAWVLHLFWTFPQPLGLLLAAVIAVGVQISAPWVDPKDPRLGDARFQEAS
jgi:hypothetical protein